MLAMPAGAMHARRPAFSPWRAETYVWRRDMRDYESTLCCVTATQQLVEGVSACASCVRPLRARTERLCLLVATRLRDRAVRPRPDS